MVASHRPIRSDDVTGAVVSDLILALTALGYTLVGAHWLTCRRRR